MVGLNKNMYCMYKCVNVHKCSTYSHVLQSLQRAVLGAQVQDKMTSTGVWRCFWVVFLHICPCADLGSCSVCKRIYGTASQTNMGGKMC